MIENKRDEFCKKKNMKIQSGCETMRNAIGQRETKYWVSTYDNSSLKIMCN